MNNKLLIPLIIVSVSGLTVSGSFSGLFIAKQVKYNQLTNTFDDLSGDYQSLFNTHEELVGDFEELSSDYQTILDDYNSLIEQYDILEGNITTLQTAYDTLNASYLALQNLFNDLQTDYNDLLQQYNDLLSDYNDREEDFGDLEQNYNDLLTQYNALQQSFNDLLSDFNDLSLAYDDLLINYNDLQDQYDVLELELIALQNAIIQLILPAQYTDFAEAVRRYYLPIYLGGKTDKTYWMAFAEYCRDVILHDSYQENSFSDVSDAFSDCLKYGSNTMNLAWYIMYNTFYDWLPNWDGWGLTGNEFTDLETLTQWCIDEIDYEYDTHITVGQEYFTYDYIKFPVETAFRTLGDCEDQAILCAAYLESCGFETMVLISHDPDHPVRGPFYHGSLMVHIEDTTTFHLLYPASLWSFGSSDPYYPDYTWCWLDPTWDIPFGQFIPWVVEYGGSISFDVLSAAICDIDGIIV